MDKATLYIRLTQEEYGLNMGMAIEIDGPLMKNFRPVDVCRDARSAFLFGGISPSEIQIVTERRKGYAKYLAEQLANGIVEMMESKDTENGYPKGL